MESTDSTLLELRVDSATLDDIVLLRHAVLRQGLPIGAAVFDGDADEATLHVAAWAGACIVGCGTLHRSTWEKQPAWQLRGMAVSPEFRGRGIGKAVLSLLEKRALAFKPTRIFWCNARTPAAEFYRRQGWRIVSDLFEIPTAGPHYRMLKIVEPAT